MRNHIKHLSALILTLGLIMPCRAEADSLTLPTYYPALSGGYDQLRFIPRSSDLSGACSIGSMYVNSSKRLQYCRDNSGVGAWGSLSDVWIQDGDNIFLTDTLAQPDLHVGIGTKTPEFKLSISTDAGIIAKGTLGSGAILPDGYAGSPRLLWYPRKAAFRSGQTNSTQWDDTNIGLYSVAMGKDSKASSDYSVVGGGDGNTVTTQYSTIIGGLNNTSSGPTATIMGGASNTVTEWYTTIVGGQSNLTNNLSSAVGGWKNNQITNLGTASNIGGGSTNTILLPYSNINGGKNNTIDQIGSAPAIQNTVIGGGANNQALNKYIALSGGSGNSAIAPFASIGGGKNNTAGFNNSGTIRGTSSRISGGEANSVTHDYATISGGQNNTVSNDNGTIGGGAQNVASGDISVVGGGQRNTASGIGAMIIGGSDNIAAGDYSWANGKNMQISAAADRTFAWGYSDTVVSITQPDSFVIAPGTLSASTLNPKVSIRSIWPTATLEINSNTSTDDYINIKRSSSGDIFIVKNNGYIGVNKATPTDLTYAMQFGNANNAYLSSGGVWTNGSSRDYKENIGDLSSKTAQQALDQLNPVTFNYKVSPQTNAGFIAEDVPEVVAMKGRKSLSSMDIIAVLTKTAQDQEAEIKDQAREIEEIQQSIERLKRALGK